MSLAEPLFDAECFFNFKLSVILSGFIAGTLDALLIINGFISAVSSGFVSDIRDGLKSSIISD